MILYPGPRLSADQLETKWKRCLNGVSTTQMEEALVFLTTPLRAAPHLSAILSLSLLA